MRQTQIEWTESFFKFVEQGKERSISIADLRHQWWFNSLSKTSLRLNKSGFEFAINLVKLKCYLHVVENPIMPKTLLQLEKFLDCPYYIRNLRSIYVFSDTISVTLTLYNNDLQSYLNHVQKYR